MIQIMFNKYETPQERKIERIQMNEIIKKEWINELRSNKWKQGYGKLGYKKERCCLGVLCEIAIKHGIIATPKITELALQYDESISLLPRTVFIWAELNSRDPQVELQELHGDYNRIRFTTLSSLTDSKMSFELISDIIEQQL